MTRHTILVVEDSDDIRFLINLMLEMKGHRVVEAVNGWEAIDRAREERPDLLLMDLSMPVMDGWEATRRLREACETREVPVVGVSAHCGGEPFELAVKAGCNDCFPKPVGEGVLDVNLARFLTMH